METMAASASPVVAVIAPGSVPKPSLTDSASSSTASSVASRTIVFSVSAAPNVRLAGTPE